MECDEVEVVDVVVVEVIVCPEVGKGTAGFAIGGGPMVTVVLMRGQQGNGCVLIIA